MLLPHLASRLYGAPLLIARTKLDTILAVLGSRIGLPAMEVALPTVPARSPAPEIPGIAAIPIHGTLVRRTLGLEAPSGLTSYQSIAAQLDAALAEPGVRAILLDVDSPGGESGGVFDLADRIRAATRVKPIWAVANDMAFSAAYALASSANRVFLSRTAGVGSIGVIALHADQSGKDAQDGVRYTTVFAGARKNDLNPHAPLSDEAFASLQAEVDRVYDLFVATVAQHRGLTPARVRATEAGLFFGRDAIDAGLADTLGTREDALNQLTQTLAAGTPALPRLSLLTEDPTMKKTPELPAIPEPVLAPEAAPEVAATAPVAPLVPAPVPVTPAPVAPTPVAATPAPVEAQRDAALDIAQTCTLAGRPELIAGFLEAGLTPARVRHQLLGLQAEASPEIASRIAPVTSPYPRPAADPADNPLLQAVNRRLAAH
jgi:signal peptide peptidase SppA